MSLMDQMMAAFDVAAPVAPAKVAPVARSTGRGATAFLIVEQPRSTGSTGSTKITVARRVFRVLVSMGDDRPDKWVVMLGCTDMADARRTAGNQFGLERVIDIRQHGA